MFTFPDCSTFKSSFVRQALVNSWPIFMRSRFLSHIKRPTLSPAQDQTQSIFSQYFPKELQICFLEFLDQNDLRAYSLCCKQFKIFAAPIHVKCASTNIGKDFHRLLSQVDFRLASISPYPTIAPGYFAKRKVLIISGSKETYILNKTVSQVSSFNFYCDSLEKELTSTILTLIDTARSRIKTPKTRKRRLLLTDRLERVKYTEAEKRERATNEELSKKVEAVLQSTIPLQVECQDYLRRQQELIFNQVEPDLYRTIRNINCVVNPILFPKTEMDDFYSFDEIEEIRVKDVSVQQINRPKYTPIKIIDELILFDDIYSFDDIEEPKEITVQYINKKPYLIMEIIDRLAQSQFSSLAFK